MSAPVKLVVTELMDDIATDEPPPRDNDHDLHLSFLTLRESSPAINGLRSELVCARCSWC